MQMLNRMKSNYQPMVLNIEQKQITTRSLELEAALLSKLCEACLRWLHTTEKLGASQKETEFLLRKYLNRHLNSSNQEQK